MNNLKHENPKNNPKTRSTNLNSGLGSLETVIEIAAMPDSNYADPSGFDEFVIGVSN